MMRRLAVLLLCLTSLLLSACVRQDAAFYSLDGDNRNSLSILRESYLWSSAWTIKLVTSNGSQCQRRYALADAPLENFRIRLYRPQAGVFILNQDDNWYVTTMQECRFQQFADAPPAPGELIGEFIEQQEQLAFITADADVRQTAQPADE
ncbi:MAG: hypothetical protein KUL75_05685 [Sterolibacterium sp.]|nr:hypothetical protein [Sterolibacterium sp.]